MHARAWGGGSTSALRDVSGGLLVLCCVTAGCADDLTQAVLPDASFASTTHDVSQYDASDTAEGDAASIPSEDGQLPDEASRRESDSTRTDPSARPGQEVQTPMGTVPADSGIVHSNTSVDADTAPPPSGPSSIGTTTPVVPPYPADPSAQEQPPAGGTSGSPGSGAVGPSTPPSAVGVTPEAPAQPVMPPSAVGVTPEAPAQPIMPPSAIGVTPEAPAQPAMAPSGVGVTPEAPAAPPPMEPAVPPPTPPSLDGPAAEPPPSAAPPDAPPQAPAAPPDVPPQAAPTPPSNLAPQTPGVAPDAPPPPANPPASEPSPGAVPSGDDAGTFADAAAGPDDLPPLWELDAGVDATLSDAAPGGGDPDAGTQIIPLLDAGNPPPLEAPDTGTGVAACEACSANTCPHQVYGDLVAYCRTLPDVALDGMRAGEPRSQLCMDLLSCTRRTRCAVEDPVDCLCGTMSQDICLEAPQLATGPCAAEAIAATETSDDYEMFERLLDYLYPSGAALNLAVCESTQCASACQ